ncbi:hypothetical protein AGMMS49587_10140 [Spirochaetia bacterium]|nr:hypothetical protein AGMMS49587_10140 [Spirochaetia bacterium]
MNKHIQRFEELEKELSEIEKTVFRKNNSSIERVDGEKLAEWRIKSKNLVGNACGKGSEHYQEFIGAEKSNGYSNVYSYFQIVRAIFNAAKDDYLGGYCASAKSLIEAEVFTSQIEQAQELLDVGYYVAAAIIAGVVLETHLRELCSSNNISMGTMNRMNDDLAKAGIYSAIIQKQITGFAAIRNSAAHGKENDAKEGFNKEQVVTMVQGIENFLATSLN